jgi:hypothetical protein
MKLSEILLTIAFFPAGAAFIAWLLVEAAFAWRLVWPRLFTCGRLNSDGWMAVAMLATLALAVLGATLRHFGA